MIPPSQESPHKPETFRGNILLFYAFDIGEEIDTDLIKRKGLININELYLSSFFKHYHEPVSFCMRDDDPLEHPLAPGQSRISSKIYNFGVLSFCYRVPFEDSFEDLKRKMIELETFFNKKSEEDAQQAFASILPAVRKARFFNSKSSYLAVHVNPIKDKINAEEFKQRYGARIASLLRFEMQNLSDYQKDEILLSTTGYYGEDLIIIDTEAAFIYDDEYLEALEFFEYATIEMAELHYFDRLLDQKLKYFYSQETYKLPLVAYLPLVGQRLELPVSRLVKLRVDISVVTERLENSIKSSGDPYYLKLYSMLVKKLLLKEWRESINRKLNIIKDVYAVYQDRLDTIHEEILTVVIIILITVEVAVAFLR